MHFMAVFIISTSPVSWKKVIKEIWIIYFTVLILNGKLSVVDGLWLPAWWALRLPWWPPAECSNVSILCAFLVFTKSLLFLYHCGILSEIKLTTTTYEMWIVRYRVHCFHCPRNILHVNAINSIIKINLIINQIIILAHSIPSSL